MNQPVENTIEAVQTDEAVTPQLEAFRAAAARFRDAGQLDGVTPFGWFLAGMGAVDIGVPFDPTISAVQITRLANFIMAEVPGEPSQSEGAVDVAIRWMRSRLGGPGVNTPRTHTSGGAEETEGTSPDSAQPDSSLRAAADVVCQLWEAGADCDGAMQRLKAVLDGAPREPSVEEVERAKAAYIEWADSLGFGPAMRTDLIRGPAFGAGWRAALKAAWGR